jgi:hypothetical protein
MTYGPIIASDACLRGFWKRGSVRSLSKFRFLRRAGRLRWPCRACDRLVGRSTTESRSRARSSAARRPIPVPPAGVALEAAWKPPGSAPALRGGPSRSHQRGWPWKPPGGRLERYRPRQQPKTRPRGFSRAKSGPRTFPLRAPSGGRMRCVPFAGAKGPSGFSRRKKKSAPRLLSGST